MLPWVVSLLLVFIAVFCSECNGELKYEKADWSDSHQRVFRTMLFVVAILALCTARYL